MYFLVKYFLVIVLYFLVLDFFGHCLVCLVF
jgi:hypothetical protein